MEQEKTTEQLLADAVERGELPSAEDLQAVARGEKPRPWRQTFSHPVHGDLEFAMELPTVADMARHSAAMDNLAVEMGLIGAARGGTILLLAAIAGLETLMKLPVVAEHREEPEDEDDPRETVSKVYYDPRGELSEQWLAEVWTQASGWRAAFLEPKALDRLGKSSGPTPGSA